MFDSTDYRVINQTWLDCVTTPGLEKRAADAATDFTRVRVREEGILRKVLPAIQVTNDKLVPDVESELPMMIVEKEPDSPAAMSVPFGGSLPYDVYIRARKYRCLFNQVQSPRFRKDVNELRTLSMDIRQVLSDNSIKDMLAEEDSTLFSAVDSVNGSQGATVAQTGNIQWRHIGGGLSRSSIKDAQKIIPQGPTHLQAATAVINNVSIHEVMKWGRDEVGGDFSQDMLMKGWSEQQFMNMNWVVTIKRDLVPDDSMYFFCDPKFTGKFFTLEDATMYVKADGPMIEWYNYEIISLTLANYGTLARADF